MVDGFMDLAGRLRSPPWPELADMALEAMGDSRVGVCLLERLLGEARPTLPQVSTESAGTARRSALTGSRQPPLQSGATCEAQPGCVPTGPQHAAPARVVPGEPRDGAGGAQPRCIGGVCCVARAPRTEGAAGRQGEGEAWGRAGH